MNHDSSPDAELQALEARLGHRAPKLSPAEQQRLLYQCAFAAGQSAAKRSLRGWQAATAVLTVLLVGATIPLTRERSSVAQLPGERPVENRLIEPTESDEETPLIAAHGVVAVSLDAWQSDPLTTASLDDELAQFAQMDSEQRSLAVGALTRRFLEQ